MRHNPTAGQIECTSKEKPSMAYMIAEDSCIGCSACLDECPNKAITARSSAFVIDPAKCTECIGFFDEPQCVALCPIDGTCIVNPNVPRDQAAV